MDTFRNIRDGGIQKVANSSERLALIPSDGDIVEQLDNNTLYAYNQSTNSWVLLTSGGGGGAVSSVFGRTGDVIAQSGDYTKTQVGLGNVDNTSDLNKPISNATQAALDDKEDVINKVTDLSSPDNITYPTTLAVSNAITNVDNIFETMKEPTGFENRTDSVITFDDSTRQFTIAPTGSSFSVWVKGKKFTITSPQTITLNTVDESKYIYFNSSGLLSYQTYFDVSIFLNNCMVSIIYWNSSTNSHSYFADERHGLTMDGATHGYLHTVFGTRYLTGLALQNFNADNNTPTDASAQFTSDVGEIRDEDILFQLNGQSQFPVLYRVNDLWQKKAASAFPLIYNGSPSSYTGTRIAYNQLVGSNWQLTEASEGYFVLMHLFATNDIETPVIALLGINQYQNTPQARAAAESEISALSGLPFTEFTAIGSVIFETRNSYTNTPKARVVSSNPSINEIYVDFRGEQLYTPSGVATSHSLLSNLGSDDHTQYFNEARGDARYLQLTGGTLTGSIAATNLSGTNTGDETNATIKTKLGAATSTNDGYLSSTDWSTFNNKQPTITGAATTITSSDLTVNRVLLSNSSGKVATSSVTDTTLGYLDATSSIQTQIDQKFSYSAIFGSGVDGNVTISSGTTTLTRDMYYNNLTISGTGRLSTAGFKIFIAGTLDLTNAPAGAIYNSGGSGGNGVNGTSSGGAAGAAGSAVPSGVVGGGATGVIGRTGVNGSAVGLAGNAGALSATPANGGTAGAGGAGANGSGGGGSGGAAGAAGTAPTNFLISRYVEDLIKNGTGTIGGGSSGGSGGSGGGGSSSTSASGGSGGSGSGGGVIYVLAKNISRGSSTAVGAIQAKGGSGGNAGNSTGVSSSAGGSGGGGGGGGGWIYLVTSSLSGTTATNAIDASGGNGGNGGNGGSGTSSGAAGGNGGGGGGGGRITYINVSSGAITESAGSAGTSGSTGSAASGTTGGSGGAGGTGNVLQLSI